MINVEFPKLPYNLNRNRKIMDYEDAEIKRLYAEGKTIAFLARKYKVHWSTIKKHIDEEYRKKSVEKSLIAHKEWYRNLSPREKKELWQYSHRVLIENTKRFQPQKDYINYQTEKNHRKPENYKKRIEQQKQYTNQPEVWKKILEKSRERYKENPDRRAYHRQYDKDFKATHKLINGKWILVDNLKWRILREMVIR